jgi:hypothetical protein
MTGVLTLARSGIKHARAGRNRPRELTHSALNLRLKEKQVAA